LPIARGLAPGSDTELCTWTDRTVDHDLDIKAVQGVQSAGGHHVVIYASTLRLPPGTQHECNDSDQVYFRFVAGAGGEGQDGKLAAPGDLVYRVAAGSQIVVNHHYINATPRPLDAQSVVNVFPADPSAHNIPSSSLAFLNSDLHLAPGTDSIEINCTMQRAIDAWFAIPHMHRYGTRATVELTSGGATQQLFNVAWTPEYTFHPPQLVRDPSNPLHLAVGDRFHVRCEWDNTSGAMLTFGREMCVAYVATVDANHTGNIACDNGDWTTF
jgi:hypothetical protein